MDESSRRAVLSGLGAGIAGVLAGCAGRAPVTGTDRPIETQAPSTPEESTPDPAFWGWLPRPAAVGGDYSFGSVAVPDARSAGLARDRLAPARFTPPQVHDVLGSTTELLTVSTGSIAGGVLHGEFDPDDLSSALESAGFAPGDDGILTGERLAFAPESSLIRWADDPAGPAALIGTLGDQVAASDETYVTTAPPVERALSAIRGTPARFGRPIDVEGGPFDTAQFLANGIGPSGASIGWTSALAFDGAVPADAAAGYRQQFVDRSGFENVRARTEAGLLVVAAETTADRATATNPL
jgi:hypothetical protein